MPSPEPGLGEIIGTLVVMRLQERILVGVVGVVAVTLGLSGQTAALSTDTSHGGAAETAGLVGQELPMNSAYVLGVGDEIIVRVGDAEEIPNDPLRIDANGDIRLPLVGRIQAGGLTVEQFETAIHAQLKAYFQDPQVLVTVSEFRSQPVSVIGAVRNPGVHQLEGRKRLIEILSLAGGLREDSGHSVKITRRVEWGRIPLPNAADDPTSQFSVAEISLPAVMEARNPQENILILPHDVVSVPRAEMVYVIGAVERSGGFVLKERENLSVLQALALAGGLTNVASKANATILRPSEAEGERTEVAINLKRIMSGRSKDVPLQAEDILFIPQSGGKAAALRAAEAGIRLGTGMLIWR